MAADQVLHIALGDSAGDELKEACRRHSLPGSVIAISDDLSNGPLNDGRERAAYWREVFGQHDDIPDDVFDGWRSVLVQTPPTVVVWSTESVSDMTFLRMACWWLREFVGAVESINVTQQSGQCGLGMHDSAELARAFTMRRPLSAEERRGLSDEFVALSEAAGGLRVYREGQIASLPSNYLDEYILSFVGAEWQRPALAIAGAMTGSDDHDRIGDAFFAWRIRQLVQAGRLGAIGELKELRTFEIRKPANSVLVP
jgi:hypothetical protein